MDSLEAHWKPVRNRTWNRAANCQEKMHIFGKATTAVQRQARVLITGRKGRFAPAQVPSVLLARKNKGVWRSTVLNLPRVWLQRRCGMGIGGDSQEFTHTYGKSPILKTWLRLWSTQKVVDFLRGSAWVDATHTHIIKVASSSSHKHQANPDPYNRSTSINSTPGELPTISRHLSCRSRLFQQWQVVPIPIRHN